MHKYSWTYYYLVDFSMALFCSNYWIFAITYFILISVFWEVLLLCFDDKQILNTSGDHSAWIETYAFYYYLILLSVHLLFFSRHVSFYEYFLLLSAWSVASAPSFPKHKTWMAFIHNTRLLIVWLLMPKNYQEKRYILLSLKFVVQRHSETKDFKILCHGGEKMTPTGL